MCVLYVTYGCKVKPRTCGCVAMGSAVLFILRSRLLLYSAGSGVNRGQVVLSGFSVLFNVRSAVPAECCVLYPYCVGVFVCLPLCKEEGFLQCLCNY